MLPFAAATLFIHETVCALDALTDWEILQHGVLRLAAAALWAERQRRQAGGDKKDEGSLKKSRQTLKKSFFKNKQKNLKYLLLQNALTHYFTFTLNVVFLSDDEGAAWADAQLVSKPGLLFVGSGLVCLRETLWCGLKQDEVRGASCSS